uniref:Reverse transcriptase domain-containing protein n=1 Tax=Panagrellus redivivus TaxID=6233 RepID=A0A7E4VT62_PANRE
MVADPAESITSAIREQMKQSRKREKYHRRKTGTLTAASNTPVGPRPITLIHTSMLNDFAKQDYRVWL